MKKSTMTPPISDHKTIYLIDGSSFLYRAYYALKPLHTPDGTAVQAVFGFCRMLKKLIKDFEPHYCALIWDSKGKTVRHEIYMEYKSLRQAAPSDIFDQKILIQEFAHLIGLHQVSFAGVEADDLMASIAQDFAQQEYQVILITSDKDLRQIVTDTIAIYDPFLERVLNQEAVEARYGFPKEKLPFYFALVGDASDNIPGVTGIGPKNAEKLVKQFQSLEDLYNNLPSAGTERVQKLLAEGKEDAFLSEKLFRIHYYDTDTKIDALRFDSNNFIRALPLFERLGFKSLIKELGKQPESDKTTFAQRYGYTFVTVTEESELAQLCAAIEIAGACAIDTETTNAIHPLLTTLVGMSFCYEQGKAYYIPVCHKTNEKQLDRDIIFKHIKPLLENPRIEKYFQNAKFDLFVLEGAGIYVPNVTFDTMVAAGLVKKDDHSIGLKFLSEKYCNEIMTTFKEVVQDHLFKSFTQVPLDKATDYAAADAHQTFKLVNILKKELTTEDQNKIFYDLEMPLLHVLYAMEKEGIVLDTNILEEIDKRVSAEIKSIVQTIANGVGADAQTINLNSPQQVSTLLFDTLNLSPVKKTKGKSGYSTDHEVLAKLAQEHPIPGYLLRYREFFKLKSTYIDALPAFINPKTARIHTTFKQTSVATGRLASVDPNLQNIPGIEMDTSGEKFSIRAAFVPGPGKVFIAADYSQMELRVLAHLSGDENLTNAFLTGQDVHAHTAAGLFGIPLKDVTSIQRQLAKKINFSILYGMTPYGLAQDLNISQAEAKEYIDNYMAHYPKVRSWMDDVIEEAKKYGYVTTWYGRRRYIPTIYERNRNLFMQACRIAINTKAQGTAADIMKLGMVQLYNNFAQQLPEAKLILQIHDELLITAPQEQAIKAEKIIKNVLQNVVQWGIPFLVTIRHGKNWEEVSK
jgi:DNA polymerase I